MVAVAALGASSVWRDWDSPMTTVAGDIGAGGTAHRLARHLQVLLDIGARHLVVDMSVVRRRDNHGLRALVATRDQARARGGRVCLLGHRALSEELDRLGSMLSAVHPGDRGTARRHLNVMASGSSERGRPPSRGSPANGLPIPASVAGGSATGGRPTLAASRAMRSHSDTVADPGSRWRGRAACRDADPEVFFPARPTRRRVETAQALCQGCSVREACLAWAIEHGMHAGIWGGTTEDARRSPCTDRR